MPGNVAICTVESTHKIVCAGFSLCRPPSIHKLEKVLCFELFGSFRIIYARIARKWGESDKIGVVLGSDRTDVQLLLLYYCTSAATLLWASNFVSCEFQEQGLQLIHNRRIATLNDILINCLCFRRPSIYPSHYLVFSVQMINNNFINCTLHPVHQHRAPKCGGNTKPVENNEEVVQNGL